MNFKKESGINLLALTSSIFTAGLMNVLPVKAAIFGSGFDSNPPMTIGDVTFLDIDGVDSALLTTEPAVPNNPFISFDLDAFLGVTLESPPLAGPLFIEEGSGLTQSFTAVGGENLSFDFNFLTNEAGFFPNDDGAFVTLLNTSTNEVSSSLLANVLNSPLNPSSGDQGFTFETGVTSFSTGPLSAGDFLLGFAVVDDFDFSGDSGLIVQNVTLNTETQVIPEPSSILGTLMALMTVGYFFYKSKKAKDLNSLHS